MSETGWYGPAIGALLLWGFWGFFPKLATAHLTPSHAIVYETVAAALFGLVVAAFLGFKLETAPLGILWSSLAGLTAVCGALLYLRACSRGPLAIVTGLYPIVTIVLGSIFLGEPLSLRRIAASALAVAAIILVVRE